MLEISYFYVCSNTIFLGCEKLYITLILSNNHFYYKLYSRVEKGALFQGIVVHADVLQ